MPAIRSTTNPHPDPLETVATALTAVGPMTAGQLAEHLGIAYSTLTPRLRQLETAGRAERVKEPPHARPSGGPSRTTRAAAPTRSRFAHAPMTTATTVTDRTSSRRGP